MAMNILNEKELENVSGGYIFNAAEDPERELYEVRNDFDGNYVHTGSTYWTKEGAIEAAKRAGMSTEEINIKQLHFLMVFHRLPKD
ncbi:MAG: bacteriocin [Lachnospiraceae bacterium]|nr:bacteriocin [Lachnospiraceae bacterium]